MKHLYIQAHAVSPLSIRTDHAPGGAMTTKYIPGTAFVGGLAAIYRLLHLKKLEEFERLFLQEHVLYPNLYPAVFEKKNLKQSKALQERNTPVSPLPKTAQSCKRHPGFKFPQHEDNDGHGVRDSLVDWGLFALSSFKQYQLDDTKRLAILDEQKDCDCREAMDHFDGYYRRNDVEPEQMMTSQVERYTRLRTHTGIDRESETVQEGILYNRQVFEEGMQFWGLVKLPDDTALTTQLQEFLEEVGFDGLVHIGTGRSRGMGKVNLQGELIEDEQERFALFKDRLCAFDILIHKQADKFEIGKLDDRHFFALTLHSPLILCDDLLRYRGRIDEDALTDMLNGLQIPDLKLIYHTASVRRVTGWLELWGTPRTNEYAIETGSVFLFMCSSPLNSPTLQSALFELEEQGAGRRRAEGFGRLCVSDQFHQEVVLR